MARLSARGGWCLRTCRIRRLDPGADVEAPNVEQRTRRLDGWMGRAAWHKLRDTGSEKAMKDTGRTGCDGHLLARACIGRALTLFRHACALGTVVAAVSCRSGSESDDGDHGQLIEQIVPILDRVSSMLITALFFTLLIISTGDPRTRRVGLRIPSRARSRIPSQMPLRLKLRLKLHVGALRFL